MIDQDEACFNLFDPNTYAEGQEVCLAKCYKPPSYELIKQQQDCTNLKLIPNDRDKFFEYILKEQTVRLNPSVQQLYKNMDHSTEVEDLIHSELFKHFGYDDSPINHQLYYALTRKFSNDPELKPQIFFWRNNVMHGSKVKLNEIPPPIPLLTLQNETIQLADILKQCHEEQKLALFFGGKSMPEYLAFAQENQDTCKCYFIYIKEAHFVERDAEGKIIEGWPRGFFEYEFPQHKKQDDRLKMAHILKKNYNIPDEFLVFQDVYPQNLFDENFGIWPDNMVVCKEGKFIWRGIINLDGSRNGNHTRTFKEQYIEKFKY